MPNKAKVSPTRTYIAICNKSNFDGHYLRRFTLPEGEENNGSHASWWFLNRLNMVACVESFVLTAEEYGGIVDQVDPNEVSQSKPATIPKWRLAEIRRSCSMLNGVPGFGVREQEANADEEAIIRKQWLTMAGTACYHDAVCALINAK